MFTRALIAFLALPGTIAFFIPAVWLWGTAHTRLAVPLGLIPLMSGFIGLLWCVRDFYVAGKGTLAPWAPPKNLVVVGLYRCSRNPMYIAVMLILLGWAIVFASRALFVYLLCVAAAFQLRVVYGEEPWLARTHGEAWRQYAGRIPRWLGWLR